MKWISLSGLMMCCLAMAQPTTVELNLFTGIQFGGEVVDTWYDDWDRNGYRYDDDIDSGSLVGGAIDFSVSRNFQIELLILSHQTEYNFSFRDKDHERAAQDLDINFFQIGGVHQWHTPTLTPYFTWSAGVADLDYEGDRRIFDDEWFEHRDDDDAHFATSIGGGFKMYFNRHLALRFDGRFWGTLLDNNDDYDCDHGCWDYDNDNTWLIQTDVKVGLVFAF